MAKKLRVEEEKLAEMTGYKVKILEKAGDRIDRKMIKSDLMEGFDCGRTDCNLCWSKGITGKTNQSCSRRSALYRGVCLQCEENGINAEYIEETGSDFYSRSKKHF